MQLAALMIAVCSPYPMRIIHIVSLLYWAEEDALHKEVIHCYCLVVGVCTTGDLEFRVGYFVSASQGISVWTEIHS